jgi:urease accessory protein
VAGPLFAGVRAAFLDGEPVVAGARSVTSVSRLAEDTAVVRLAAISVEELIRELRARLAAIPALLGDDPWARRA